MAWIIKEFSDGTKRGRQVGSPRESRHLGSVDRWPSPAAAAAAVMTGRTTPRRAGERKGERDEMNYAITATITRASYTLSLVLKRSLSRPPPQPPVHELRVVPYKAMSGWS